MVVCIKCGNTDVQVDRLKKDKEKAKTDILHTQVYICKKCRTKFYEVDYFEETCYAELK